MKCYLIALGVIVIHLLSIIVLEIVVGKSGQPGLHKLQYAVGFCWFGIM